MPVKMKGPSNLEVGSYFFVGRYMPSGEPEPKAVNLYCVVTKPGEAKVINGAYTVRVDAAKREVSIPYSKIKMPIIHEGRPEIEDLNDYDAAFEWLEKIW